MRSADRRDSIILFPSSFDISRPYPPECDWPASPNRPVTHRQSGSRSAFSQVSSSGISLLRTYTPTTGRLMMEGIKSIKIGLDSSGVRISLNTRSSDGGSISHTH